MNEAEKQALDAFVKHRDELCQIIASNTCSMKFIQALKDKVARFDMYLTGVAFQLKDWSNEQG